MGYNKECIVNVIDKVKLDEAKTLYFDTFQVGYALIQGYIVTTVKPIFHCNAKTLALGHRVGQYPQRESFALGIPTCWYLKMLKFALAVTQTPNANRWIIGCIASPTQNYRFGHVDFMLFVLISFALVTQCDPSLQWNMGLRCVGNSTEN